SREKRSPIIGAHTRYSKKKEAHGGDEWTYHERSLGSVAADEPAGPPRQQEHQQNHRKRSPTRRGGGIFLYLDQIQRKQKEENPQRGVQTEGQPICATEVSGFKKVQRDHRCCCALLHKYEEHKQRRAENYTSDYAKMIPAQDRRFQKSINQCRKA